MEDNCFYKNLDTNEYFRSLPSFVQEAIRQSSPQINSEEDLRRCAKNLLERM